MTRGFVDETVYIELMRMKFYIDMDMFHFVVNRVYNVFQT